MRASGAKAPPRGLRRRYEQRAMSNECRTRASRLTPRACTGAERPVSPAAPRRATSMSNPVAATHRGRWRPLAPRLRFTPPRRPSPSPAAAEEGRGEGGVAALCGRWRPLAARRCVPRDACRAGGTAKTQRGQGAQGRSVHGRWPAAAGWWQTLTPDSSAPSPPGPLSRCGGRGGS